jgi:uncharacterized protein (TIGR02284 family)
MTSAKSRDISTAAQATVNELIATSKDGEKGFFRAADESDDRELRALFTECAARCRAAAKELQDALRAFGGQPAQEGTLLGTAHRGWLDLKAVLSRNNAVAILEECENGESYARIVYEGALSTPLPPEIQPLIERQHRGVVANYERVRELLDLYRRSSAATTPALSQSVGSQASGGGTGPESRFPHQNAKFPNEHVKRRLIAETAYFIAERRGFTPGYELDDWLQAEQEVEASIASVGP